ncbi:MAG: GTP 3',8-cyclase MoaA [Chromatiales bacterium]|jgi:cyclic pyranopterin phosphate synthase
MTTSSHASALIDPFGRQVEYVRLSVTDKCNMRCFYCIPQGFTDFEEPQNWLTFEEIERFIAAFASLGVRRLRLTGGEPLVRRNLPELAANLSAIDGIEDLSLSTNAALLRQHAGALKQAGISRINVSLDSLDPERFRQVTRGDLEQVLDGLMEARRVGLSPVKINMVAMKGVNDSEFEAMVDFCLENDFTLRLIETMPVGNTGRDATDRFMDLREVRARLARRYELIPDVMPGGGPARYVRIGGTELRIGFITPISQHFCETCNRVRISVDGTLYLCLGQEDKVEFRPMLRDGASHEELRDAIIRALALKPERHEFRERPEQVIRIMSQTGG